MGLGSVLAIPVVILGVVVLWLNEPLPPNTANPIKYKLFAAKSKAIGEIAFIQSWWTGEDARIVEQQMLRTLAVKAHLDDPDILATQEIFDGVPVYIYQPIKQGENRPGLLYFHGGGFVNGHPVGFESLNHKFVKALDMVVIAVDYRLSPQAKAPAAHEDCMKATQYFFTNAAKYNVDRNYIGAGGDSAGGNLAAALSLVLRDKGSQQFQYQLLIYPNVQLLDVQTPSYQQNCPSSFRAMTYDTMSMYFVSFLGLPVKYKADMLANKHVKPETWEKYEKYLNINEIPKDSIPQYYKKVRPTEINQEIADMVQDIIANPYIFPLLADDLSNLPPAYVLTVENDPLRDDGIWFANRLKRAGNKVVYDHSVDGFHGMIRLQAGAMAFDSATRPTENMIRFIKDVNAEERKTPEERTKKVVTIDHVDTKAAKAANTPKTKVPVKSKEAPVPTPTKVKTDTKKKAERQDVKIKKSKAGETQKPVETEADVKKIVKKDPRPVKPSQPSQGESKKTNKDKKAKTSQAGVKADTEKSDNQERTKSQAKGNKSGQRKEAISKNKDGA